MEDALFSSFISLNIARHGSQILPICQKKNFDVFIY
jgi:hypothetical protein